MTPTEKFELAMQWNVFIFLAQLAIGCIPLLLMICFARGPYGEADND